MSALSVNKPNHSDFDLNLYIMYEFLKSIPKDCEVSFFRNLEGDFEITINKGSGPFILKGHLRLPEVDLDRNSGNYVLDLLKTAYKTL
jgi:hypothetical protein